MPAHSSSLSFSGGPTRRFGRSRRSPLATAHCRITWAARFLHSSSRPPRASLVGTVSTALETEPDEEDDSCEIFPTELIPMGPEQVFRSRPAGFFRSRPEQVFRSRAEVVFRSGFGPDLPE